MYVTTLKGHIWYGRRLWTTTYGTLPVGVCLLWGVAEVFQGEEGPPEASFGCVIGQCRDEGGEDEACRALRPGEPDTWFGIGERLSDQWEVQGIYVADGAWAD